MEKESERQSYLSRKNKGKGRYALTVKSLLQKGSQKGFGNAENAGKNLQEGLIF